MQAKWKYALGLVLLAAGVLGLVLSPAQCQNNFNEREIKSQKSSLDKADVWSLDFRFKDPRLIKVNIPARGTRICWYLWYQVINRTAEPRQFIPDFELVTLDHPAAYRDEVIGPAVEDAIKRIEDPTGYQDIKNSVTITKNLIPLSKAEGEAFPRAVTGVAIWDGTAADPKKRDPKVKDLSDATRFTIFIRGLSNGYVLVKPLAEGLPETTRYKTLQLNFQRKGDRLSLDSREISFVPPSEWIYRPARRSEEKDK